MCGLLGRRLGVQAVEEKVSEGAARMMTRAAGAAPTLLAVYELERTVTRLKVGSVKPLCFTCTYSLCRLERKAKEAMLLLLF